MKKVHLQLNLFLLFAIALMLPACAAKDTANQLVLSDQEIRPVEAVDQDGDPIVGSTDRSDKCLETSEGGDIEMYEDEDDLDLDEDNDNAKKNNCNSMEDDCQTSLFSEFEEISKDQYIHAYGEGSLTEHPVTTVASRFGRVDFDQAALSPGFIKSGSLLRLILFGETVYCVSVNNVTEGVYRSISGSVVGSAPGFFVLTVSDNKVLATLEIYGANAIYLIRYNPVSGRHYIYQSPMDAVERLPD